jgi:chromate transport protein ChrA
MQSASGITIHAGWLEERWFGCLVTTILSILGSATLVCNQELTRLSIGKIAKVSAIRVNLGPRPVLVEAIGG